MAGIGLKPNTDCAKPTRRMTSLLAAIYSEDMPDWACELNEVAENLHRKELIPKERDAHTVLYAALLKKHGSVVEAKNGARQDQTQVGWV